MGLSIYRVLNDPSMLNLKMHIYIQKCGRSYKAQDMLLRGFRKLPRLG